MEYGATSSGTSSSHIYAEQAANISISGDYSISGSPNTSSGRHYWANSQAQIYAVGNTITISTAITVGQFARVTIAGLLQARSQTFVNPGNVTGQRYAGTGNGVILTYGGATYFPGTVAGAVATGAIYL
jgi:hypothetical protein